MSRAVFQSAFRAAPRTWRLRVATLSTSAAVAALVWLSFQLAQAAPDDAAAKQSKPVATEGGASAATPANPAKPGPARPLRRPRDAAMPAFTPEREAAAMTFVRQHHPELADLLEKLKENNPERYRRAVRELFLASERVAQWKDRDAQRYELELKAWQVSSRIQLLLARGTMSDDAALEGELKAALAERADVRIAARKLEREQIARRLADADADIKRLEADRQASIDKQLSQLRQGLDRSRKKVRQAANKKPLKAEAKAESKSGSKPESKTPATESK